MPMTLKQVTAAHRLQHPHEEDIVKDRLKIYGVRQATEIDVYTTPPYFWTAVVGVFSAFGHSPFLYIFECYRGKMKTRIELPNGFRENGRLIF